MEKHITAKAVWMALACAFILTACGGGGGAGAGGASTGLTASAAVPKTSVLVASYGDSTTKGLQCFNGVCTVTPNSDPADLQKLLQQQFGPIVTVSNQGVDGSQAVDLLNGTDKNHAPWAQEMAMSKADIVTLNFGRNDADYFGISKPGVTLTSPEQFGQVITQLVQIATAAGKKVVLYEPDLTSFSDANIALVKYVAQLQMVSTKLGVPLVQQWDYSQGVPNYSSMLSDGVHPTDALYALNAQWEAQIVAPIVHALLR